MYGVVPPDVTEVTAPSRLLGQFNGEELRVISIVDGSTSIAAQEVLRHPTASVAVRQYSPGATFEMFSSVEVKPFGPLHE